MTPRPAGVVAGDLHVSSAETKDGKPSSKMLKVICCGIAVREVCHVVAKSKNFVDLEFLEQGYHDTPAKGRDVIQERVNAIPVGRYDAILLGYGLCSNMIVGLTTPHTPVVVPRAHDCITFFLGSKERYQQTFVSHPGTYYYTAGWLECWKRSGLNTPSQGAAEMGPRCEASQWEQKYGEDEARYLREVMREWSQSYTRGALIDFDFSKHLNLAADVRHICADRGWKFEEITGDISLLQRWVDGDWESVDFVIVHPNEKVVATCDERVVDVQKTSQTGG